MAGFDPENLHVIETLVTSRAKTIDYIRRVHGGGVRYLDIVEISSAEIATAYATDKRQPIVKRVEQWFNLGMSLAPLLRLNSSEVYVRAVAQLVEEYDYFYANAASKGLRLLKGVGGPSKEQAEAEGLIRPTVGGAYEQLQITRLPFALGYTPTVLSLLEILGHVYKKFIDPVCSKPHLFDGIQRIDKKLQALVILPAQHDVHVIGVRNMNQSMLTLASLLQVQTAYGSGTVARGFAPASTVDEEFVVLDDPHRH